MLNYDPISVTGVDPFPFYHNCPCKVLPTGKDEMEEEEEEDISLVDDIFAYPVDASDGEEAAVEMEEEEEEEEEKDSSLLDIFEFPVDTCESEAEQEGDEMQDETEKGAVEGLGEEVEEEEEDDNDDEESSMSMLFSPMQSLSAGAEEQAVAQGVLVCDKDVVDRESGDEQLFLVDGKPKKVGLIRRDKKISLLCPICEENVLKGECNHDKDVDEFDVNVWWSTLQSWHSSTERWQTLYARAKEAAATKLSKPLTLADVLNSALEKNNSSAEYFNNVIIDADKKTKILRLAAADDHFPARIEMDKIPNWPSLLCYRLVGGHDALLGLSGMEDIVWPERILEKNERQTTQHADKSSVERIHQRLRFLALAYEVEKDEKASIDDSSLRNDLEWRKCKVSSQTCETLKKALQTARMAATKVSAQSSSCRAETLPLFSDARSQLFDISKRRYSYLETAEDTSVQTSKRKRALRLAGCMVGAMIMCDNGLRVELFTKLDVDDVTKASIRDRHARERASFAGKPFPTESSGIVQGLRDVELCSTKNGCNLPVVMNNEDFKFFKLIAKMVVALHGDRVEEKNWNVAPPAITLGLSYQERHTTVVSSCGLSPTRSQLLVRLQAVSTAITGPPIP